MGRERAFARDVSSRSRSLHQSSLVERPVQVVERSLQSLPGEPPVAMFRKIPVTEIE
jgi:hypothetical protein